MDDSTAPVERCFTSIDLVGYTALTDTHGDDIAAALAMTMARHARAALGSQDELVKLLGDGVLIASTDPQHALELIDRLHAALAAEDFIMAIRAGIHHGHAIPIEGNDYLGAAVNLTARLTHEARPGELIATEVVSEQATRRGDLVTPLGPRRLRHIGEPVEVFSIVLASRPPLTELDPVCHMRPPADGFAVLVRWHDRTVGFCSEDCAQRFAADPETYGHHLDDC